MKEECRVVALALDDESKCKGEFCQYSINLGQDWLHTCRSIAPDQVSAVEAQLVTMRQSSQVSAGDCGREAREFIERGCPRSADCAQAAQHWATRCGTQATPLVVRMIEKRVERSTQTPTKLDVTSCEQIFAEITKTTECGNDFECQEKVEQFNAYQTRCTTPGAPIPVEQGLKQALLLDSAKQPPKAIFVSEGTFAAKQNRLMLDGGKGFVVGVGDQVVPSVKLLISALDSSEFALPIKLARISPGRKSAFELRVGRVAAPDASTLFRRFPSLRFEGQPEAEKHAAANRAIEKLNQVVTKTAQEEILAGLVGVLGDAAIAEDDSEFREQIARADKHLSPAFAKLAVAKRQRLPSPRDPKDRVAFARRNWLHPFADVNAEGNVELGAVTGAVLANVEVLLPKSFEAYRKEIDLTVGLARRTLPNAIESELKGAVATRAKECADARESARALEKQLLDCGFAIKACDGDGLEGTTEKLDQALHDQELARARLRSATLSLEKGPDKKLEKAIAGCP
jgi:hypothetical protein